MVSRGGPKRNTILISGIDTPARTILEHLKDIDDHLSISDACHVIGNYREHDTGHPYHFLVTRVELRNDHSTTTSTSPIVTTTVATHDGWVRILSFSPFVWWSLSFLFNGWLVEVGWNDEQTIGNRDFYAQIPILYQKGFNWKPVFAARDIPSKFALDSKDMDLIRSGESMKIVMSTIASTTMTTTMTTDTTSTTVTTTSPIMEKSVDQEVATSPSPIIDQSVDKDAKRMVDTIILTEEDVRVEFAIQPEWDAAMLAVRLSEKIGNNQAQFISILKRITNLRRNTSGRAVLVLK